MILSTFSLKRLARSSINTVGVLPINISTSKFQVPDYILNFLATFSFTCDPDFLCRFECVL